MLDDPDVANRRSGILDPDLIREYRFGMSRL